jgi:hypothetical protein
MRSPPKVEGWTSLSGIAMDTGTNPTPLVRGLNNTIPPNIDNDNKEYADRVFQVRLLIMSVW